MSLVGATTYLHEAQLVNYDAIEDDQQEEIESMIAANEVDDAQEQTQGNYLHSQLSEPELKRTKINHDIMTKNLIEASKNIVVTNTLSEYRRLWQQFTEFCVSIEKVKQPKDVDCLFPNLPADFPEWIAMWIMDRCDDIDIITGKAKGLNICRVTYATAQKMRAAVSHKFGRDFGLGTQPWLENPLRPGHFSGNPSLSVSVSQYMISLRRRKIRAGEVVTSARAMDEATMKRLWEYNENFAESKYEQLSRKRKAEHPEDWAGHNVRSMLQLLYTVSMLCLLRYDEALRITWADVTFEENEGQYRVRLALPFRKTHQNGEIAPFYLYINSSKPWMCPVRGFAKWWALTEKLNLDPNGYIFRKKLSGDSVSITGSDAMSSEAFLECFRNNLLDIGIDPRPYGTHSFRRGGCQYLATVCRWHLRSICSWGGWTENFDNPGTIFKYLLSWTDTPMVQREDYFNPRRGESDPCSACGRTCLCA